MKKDKEVQLNELIEKAKNLSHRNKKEKDALILEIIDFLIQFKYDSTFVKDLKLISFEYLAVHKGFHSSRHDESWVKGKKDLVRFFESLK